MNKKLLSGLMAAVTLFGQGASLSAQKPSEGVISKFLKNNKELVSKGISLLALTGGVAYIYRNNDNPKNDSPKNDIPKADKIKRFNLKNDGSKKEPVPVINLREITYAPIRKRDCGVKVEYPVNVNSIGNFNRTMAGFLMEGSEVEITSFKGKASDAVRFISNISSKIDKRISILADGNTRELIISNAQNYDILLRLETNNENKPVLRYSFKVSEQKPATGLHNISARYEKYLSRDLSGRNKSVNLSKDYTIEIKYDDKWKYICVYNNSYKHESLSQVSEEERSRLINEIYDIVEESDKKGISVIINGYIKRDSNSNKISDDDKYQASEFLNDLCEKIGTKELEAVFDLKVYNKGKSDTFKIEFSLDENKKLDRVAASLGQ